MLKNNEEAQGGQSSVTDKEDLLKIPRKDARATLVNGGTSGKVSPGLGGGPSGSDRGMEEGMRELTDRGILGQYVLLNKINVSFQMAMHVTLMCLRTGVVKMG